MEKTERVRECLRRAGLFLIPAGDEEALAPYGFDSLLSVMTVIEMQKEFRITISTESIRPDSFTSVKNLSHLIPDSQ